MSYNKGIKYVINGEVNNAIKQFELATTNGDNIINAYIELGKCYLLLKEFKKAQMNFSYVKMLLNNSPYESKPISQKEYVAYAKTICINKMALYEQLNEEELLKKELIVLKQLLESNTPPINFLNPIRD